MQQQREFEAQLFAKTSRTQARTEGPSLLSPPQSPCVPWPPALLRALRRPPLPAWPDTTGAVVIDARGRAAEIILFNKNIVVYKFATDVYFYVTGQSLADQTNLPISQPTTRAQNSVASASVRRAPWGQSNAPTGDTAQRAKAELAFLRLL